MVNADPQGSSLVFNGIDWVLVLITSLACINIWIHCRFSKFTMLLEVLRLPPRMHVAPMSAAWTRAPREGGNTTLAEEQEKIRNLSIKGSLDKKLPWYGHPKPHSLTCSFTAQSLTHSIPIPPPAHTFTRPPTDPHSVTQSLTLTHPLTHSPTNSLTHSLSQSLTHPLIHLLLLKEVCMTASFSHLKPAVYEGSLAWKLRLHTFKLSCIFWKKSW